MKPEVKRKVTCYLGLANRQRKVVSGRTEVSRFLEKGELRILLFAEDVPEKLERTLRNTARERRVPVVKALSRGELGDILGTRDRIVAGVLDDGLADAILNMCISANEESGGRT